MFVLCFTGGIYQALVNVPAVSERSIRSDFSSSKTTSDAQIQVNSLIMKYACYITKYINVLDEAAEHNLNEWRWLKADSGSIN